MDNKTKAKSSAVPDTAGAAVDAASSSATATAAAVERATRRYDLVVWGATGFTGQLVVQYITRRQHVAKHGAGAGGANAAAADDGYAALKWAIGGRSRDKLTAAKATAVAELTAADGGALHKTEHDVVCGADIVIADSGNAASLELLVKQTRVVLTTVGPYTQYGSGLVAACAAHGTDYVDITGEHMWVKAMIDAHHDTCVRTGAIVVPCCGYDSIPSDVGTYMVVNHLQRTFGAGTAVDSVQTTAAAGGGAGASGGTLHTMMGIMEQAANDPTHYGALLRNPYVLVPDAAHPRDGAVRGEQEVPLPMSVPHGRAPGKAAWTAPFLMSTVNGAITRRSAYVYATRDHGARTYGPKFVYKSERMVMPHVWAAIGFIVVLACVALACAFGVVRRAVVKYLLPAQGAGPSKQQRATAWFRTTLIAHGTTTVAGGGDHAGVHAVAQVRGGDPGYGDTAKMVTEAAMCLVQARDRIPAAGNGNGGILTPASAFGDVLIERLRGSGLQLEVLTASADSPLVVAKPVGEGAGAGGAAGATAGGGGGATKKNA